MATATGRPQGTSTLASGVSPTPRPSSLTSAPSGMVTNDAVQPVAPAAAAATAAGGGGASAGGSSSAAGSSPTSAAGAAWLGPGFAPGLGFAPGFGSAPGF